MALTAILRRRRWRHRLYPTATRAAEETSTVPRRARTPPPARAPTDRRPAGCHATRAAGAPPPRRPRTSMPEAPRAVPAPPASAVQPIDPHEQIAAAAAQRRHLDLPQRQARIQITPERPRFDVRGQ